MFSPCPPPKMASVNEVTIAAPGFAVTFASNNKQCWYSSCDQKLHPLQAAAPPRRLLPPREDLGDFRDQLEGADWHRREKLQIAHMQDYEATVGTSITHIYFLRMMLREVQQFQRRVHRVTISPAVIRCMSRHLHSTMCKDDSDQYIVCLAFFCNNRVYCADAFNSAEDLVKEEHTAATSP